MPAPTEPWQAMALEKLLGLLTTRAGEEEVEAPGRGSQFLLPHVPSLHTADMKPTSSIVGCGRTREHVCYSCNR